jgi:hypothetical protein
VGNTALGSGALLSSSNGNKNIRCRWNAGKLLTQHLNRLVGRILRTADRERTLVLV